MVIIADKQFSDASWYFLTSVCGGVLHQIAEFSDCIPSTFLLLPLALLLIIDIWGMNLYRSSVTANLYISNIISFTGSYWLKCACRILPS